MSTKISQSNVDAETVEGFGAEWSAFDQTVLIGEHYNRLFENYFAIFPFEMLPASAVGFDLGCGSGRWAAGVAPRVGALHCIDPSKEALDVARRRLADRSNVQFHLADANSIPLADGSQDFGYSLGVLHHIPDASLALDACVRKLKPGAPFLIYLYYSFDNRPAWFRLLWKVTDLLRQTISKTPFRIRKIITDVIAVTIYWPLAKLSLAVEKFGVSSKSIPLSFYRSASLYTMRTDALDRFGTRLEQRFSKTEIETMMVAAGLKNIRFSSKEPYWTACGFR